MMKKRLFGLLCALILVLSYSMPVLAWNEMPLLVDEADLLTESEEGELLSRLEAVSESGQTDVVVVTIDSLQGESAQDYADDFYDENGYAEDGVLLLISIGDSEWYISTTGFGITAVTDAGLEYISDHFVDQLSDGAFFDAFMTYADLCDEFIWQARNGEPYDIGNMPKDPFSFFGNLMISLVIGLVAALIITGKMKADLKSVNMEVAASNYVKNGSLKVTQSKELFLYRNVNRRARPKQTSSGGSSTHRSSSGRSHGGGGGKF